MQQTLASVPLGTVLFDGDCLVCSGGARFLTARDHKRQFRLLPLQSPQAQALLQTHGLPSNYRESLLFLRGPHLLMRSEAVIALLSALPWPWSLAHALRLIPLPLRDRIYDLVAQNRHRIPFFRPRCNLPQGR